MMKSILCLAIGGILFVNQINGVETKQSSISKLCKIEIAVGSTNPVKIQAVKNALNDEDICVTPCSASSKVRPQPLSD